MCIQAFRHSGIQAFNLNDLRIYFILQVLRPVGLIIAFYSCMISSGFAQSNLSAEEILKRSNQKMVSLGNYYVEMENKDEKSGAHTITKIWVKNNPDGTSKSRTESVSKFKVKDKEKELRSLTIQDESGVYDVRKEMIIKMEFQTQMMQSVTSSVAEQLDSEKLKQKFGSFEVSEGSVHGTPCHEVKMTLSKEGKELMVNALKTPEMEAMLKVGNLSIDQIPLPVVQVYLIEKGNFYFRGMKTFDQNGNMLQELIYKDFKANVAEELDRYALPKGLPVKIAKTVPEYAAYIAEEFNPKNKDKY